MIKIIRSISTTVRRKSKIKKLEGTYFMSNVVGTSHDRGSKKAFWEKHSGRYFGVCQVGGCKSRATVGAHVRIWSPITWLVSIFPGFTSLSSRRVFIVPLCQVETKYTLRSLLYCLTPYKSHKLTLLNFRNVIRIQE